MPRERDRSDTWRHGTKRENFASIREVLVNASRTRQERHVAPRDQARRLRLETKLQHTASAGIYSFVML